jgi:hypothetical protein
MWTIALAVFKIIRRLCWKYLVWRSQMLQYTPSFSFWKSASNNPLAPKKCSCKLLTHSVRLYCFVIRCVSYRAVTNPRQVRKYNFCPDSFKNAFYKSTKDFPQTSASADTYIFMGGRTFKVSCYLQLHISKTGRINCIRWKLSWNQLRSHAVTHFNQEEKNGNKQ